MNKKGYILILAILCLLLTGCNNKYEGYWCRYNETATIVVLLKEDITESQKNTISDKINNFVNLDSVSYYNKENYSELIGDYSDSLFDAYVVSFTSLDSIGTYVDELNKLDGVEDASQNSAKNNIELYHLGKNKKYSFTNSDEANDEDLINGKYKIKNGVITFNPTDGSKTTMLYIKDEHLCGDAECTKIFAKSDAKCSSLSK